MSLVQLFVLAVIQGITEFLPISSSGHLVLVPMVIDWPDQGPLIDVAAHFGTFLAVCLYFRRDVWDLSIGFGRALGGSRDPRARLFVQLAIATVPLVVFGAGLYALGWLDLLRSAAVIGWTSIGFGVLLLISDRIGITIRRVEHLNLPGAVWIGLAQALALIPGTSRAGICITAARFLGFERADAARLSMLLSIPAIGAAAGLGAFEIWRSGESALGIEAVITAVVSFLVALAAIAGLMKWLRRSNYTPFVIYRVVLGAALLAWTYGVI